jgi:hypothetical protein
MVPPSSKIAQSLLLTLSEGEEIGQLIARAVEPSATERRPWYEPMEKLPREPLINSAMLREFDTLVVEMPPRLLRSDRKPRGGWLEWGRNVRLKGVGGNQSDYHAASLVRFHSLDSVDCDDNPQLCAFLSTARRRCRFAPRALAKPGFDHASVRTNLTGKHASIGALLAQATKRVGPRRAGRAAGRVDIHAAVINTFRRRWPVCRPQVRPNRRS